MEVLHSAPTASSFTPLSTHQSQTPDSFFTGPPILHHHSPSATLKIHSHDLAATPALSGLAAGIQQRRPNDTSLSSAAIVNGHAEGQGEDEGGSGEELEITGVDVWVTSEFVFPTIPSTSSQKS